LNTKFHITWPVIFLILISTIINSCSPSLEYQGLVNDPAAKTEIGKNQLSIITYNIKGIFNKEQTMFDDLFRYINNEKYDFVVFQELFNEEMRDSILTNIDTTVYSSKTSRVDYEKFPSNIFQDSGLFLMSRYPLVDLSTLNFSKNIYKKNGIIFMPLKKEFSITLDFIANKSILGALHQINDSTNLFLFSTHLQAIGSITHKQIQLMQIFKFIESSVNKVIKEGIVKSENLIVVLAGDFNTDAYTDDGYIEMISYLGNPRDLHKEFHLNNKEYSIIFKTFNAKMRFDYIFAYNQISSTQLKPVKVQSINVTDIRDKNNNSVSDHFALKASLQFD